MPAEAAEDSRPGDPTAMPSQGKPRMQHPSAVEIRPPAPRRDVPRPSVNRRIQVHVGNPVEDGGNRAARNPDPAVAIAVDPLSSTRDDDSVGIGIAAPRGVGINPLRDGRCGLLHGCRRRRGRRGRLRLRRRLRHRCRGRLLPVSRSREDECEKADRNTVTSHDDSFTLARSVPTAAVMGPPMTSPCRAPLGWRPDCAHRRLCTCAHGLRRPSRPLSILPPINLNKGAVRDGIASRRGGCRRLSRCSMALMPRRVEPPENGPVVALRRVGDATHRVSQVRYATQKRCALLF